MSYLIEIGLSFLVGFFANLFTPKLSFYLISWRDKLFLNRVYYIIKIRMRTIGDIDKISLVSEIFKVDKSGNAQDTYSLNFLVSCLKSDGFADFLDKRHLEINLTFTGAESVMFYPLNLHTKLPKNESPTKYIKFGPDKFKSPSDDAYSALLTSRDTQGNFTIRFSYSLVKTNSEKIYKNLGKWRVIFKEATTFDSLHTDSITCEKT